MCGIVGIWSDSRPEQKRAAVRDMISALRHRGPDASGSVDIATATANLVLGHTRLSILDLSDGSRQPMHDATSGSWLVFNGEIYNFRRLRAELEELGASFSSSGDTEVLLQSLVHWGEAALDKLEGMFSFAFWNGRTRSLLLARDRMGIKPLYYWQSRRDFAFASEVKALQLARLGELRLDANAVDSFLAYGAVIGPQTMYREIRELQPGHLLRVAEGGEVCESEYWSLSRSVLGNGAGKLSFAEAAAQLREHLAHAVESQLVSDVPVGVFLSGGVDSSLLALLASRSAKSPISLLTVAFSEAEFSELEHARKIAQALPHHHEVVRLSAAKLHELLPDALSAMDQPTVDGINTYVIARVGASLGLKVLLSGVGGDELFGGYTTFTKVPRLLRFGAGLRPAARVLSRLGTKNPIAWKKVADAGAMQNLAQAYLLQRSIRWQPDNRRTLSIPLQKSIDPFANNFQKLAGLELQFYMRNQLLRDADVFSMANSVELRVPFLDEGLLQAALRIAPKHHFEASRGKRITRHLLSDLAGEPLQQRPKMGFTFPWQQWLRRDLNQTIKTTLLDRRLFEPLGLDAGYGGRLLHGLEAGERTQSWSEVWSLFVLLNWQRRIGVECAVA